MKLGEKQMWLVPGLVCEQRYHPNLYVTSQLEGVPVDYESEERQDPHVQRAISYS